MNATAVARIIDGAISAYRAEIGQDASPSTPPMIEGMAEAVRAIWACPTDPTPEWLHDRWLTARKAAGWTHGPVRDVEAKISPALTPWAELPREERLKGRIFLQLAQAFDPNMSYDDGCD